MDEAPKSNHKIFFDDEEAAKNFDPVEHFDTLPELVDKPQQRLRKDQLKEPVVVGGAKIRNKKDLQRIEKQRVAGYQEMQARLDRLTKLEKLEAKLDVQKKLLVRLPIAGAPLSRR